VASAIRKNDKIEMHGSETTPTLCEIGQVFVNVNRATQENKFARLQAELCGLHCQIGAMAGDQTSQAGG
jgi:hypothetical protein